GADTLWSLALRIDTLQAAKALAALPAPAFARLRGMKLEGRFAFGMSADYRSSAPDSLRFSARAYLKPLRIRSYGAANFAALNESFLRPPPRDKRPVQVGPPGSPPWGATPAFVPLAIVTAEDGGYFWHGGIDGEA